MNELLIGAAVAIVSLLVNPAAQYFVQLGEWKRRRKAERSEKIDRTMLEFATCLEKAHMAELTKDKRVAITEALWRYYAWERAIWAGASGEQRRRIRDLWLNVRDRKVEHETINRETVRGVVDMTHEVQTRGRD